MNKKAFFSSLFALAYMGLILLSYSYSSNQTTSITDITDVKREFFLSRMFLDKYISDMLLKTYVTTCGATINPFSLDLSNFSTYYPRCSITKQSESLTATGPNTFSYTLNLIMRCTNNNALYESQLNFSKNITINTRSTPPPTFTFLITDGFSGILEASASAC